MYRESDPEGQTGPEAVARDTASAADVSAREHEPAHRHSATSTGDDEPGRDVSPVLVTVDVGLSLSGAF